MSSKNSKTCLSDHDISPLKMPADTAALAQGSDKLSIDVGKLLFDDSEPKADRSVHVDGRRDRSHAPFQGQAQKWLSFRGPTALEAGVSLQIVSMFGRGPA